MAQALSLAASAYSEWKQTTVAHRAHTLRQIGLALRNRAEEMAQCISREMGKPIKQARGEVAKSAALCDWYAEHGPAMLN
ncbi:aldehyde dehydrogenase family protein, partial [Enterobacter hormaechei]